MTKFRVVEELGQFYPQYRRFLLWEYVEFWMVSMEIHKTHPEELYRSKIYCNGQGLDRVTCHDLRTAWVIVAELSYEVNVMKVEYDRTLKTIIHTQNIEDLIKSWRLGCY